MKTDTCRSCGRKILWGVTAEGKKIPLDAVAPCYIDSDPGVNHEVARSCAHVSHFSVCPAASEWSGKTRKEKR